ncbi:MAG: hypothetical protein CEO21_323 [Microgenomates group bacterium Gr01-1014_80]|nr:MAG: hypothetical protein CEO21_323 [Microgenomates group bacterium Gr01-1014_80]
MAVMTAARVRLYQETYGLLKAYNTNLTFRTSFKNAVALGKKSYVGTPLWMYLWTLSEAAPHLSPRINRIIRTINSASTGEAFKEVADSFDKLLEDYWAPTNSEHLNHLREEVEKIDSGEIDHPDFISDQDHQDLSEIYSSPEGPAREANLEQFSSSRGEGFHAPPVFTPHLVSPLAPPAEPLATHGPGEPDHTPGVSAESLTQSHTGSEPGVPQEPGPSEHPRGEEPGLPPAGHPGGEPQGRRLVGEQKAVVPEAFKTPAPPFNKRSFPLPKFKIPKVPEGIATPIKNFMHRNLTLTKITPLFTGGIGTAMMYGITNSPVMAAIGGLGGGLLPSLFKREGFSQLVTKGGLKIANGGASFVGGLTPGGTGVLGRGGSIIGGGGKKAALLTSLLFIGLAVFLVGFAPQTPQTTPGGGTGVPTGSGALTRSSCPDQAAIDQNKQSPNSCKYFGLGVDIFNTNISQTVLESYINKYSSIFTNAGKGDLNQFRTRVNYIVTKSKEVGITPVLALGYWRTESNFSTVGTRDLGCHPSAIDFYEQVDCKLGINEFSNPNTNPITNCARSKDSNSTACNALKSIRRTLDQNNPIKYPVSTFDDFAEAYGSRDPGLDGPGKVNNNCVSTYNKLVEVAAELNSCVVSAPAPVISTPFPISGKLVTCPLEGKRVIGCGSWKSDPKYNRNLCAGSNPVDRGHCGNTYGRCTAGSRREHSIDVDANPSEQVKLPFINGKSSQWFNPSGTRYGPLSSNDGGGYGHVFNTEVDGDIWVVHFVHMNANVIPPPLGRGYQSGDPVVTVADTPYDHLHVNIGKNPAGVDGGNGWLDPESLGMCTD